MDFGMEIEEGKGEKIGWEIYFYWFFFGKIKIFE